MVVAIATLSTTASHSSRSVECSAITQRMATRVRAEGHVVGIIVSVTVESRELLFEPPLEGFKSIPGWGLILAVPPRVRGCLKDVTLHNAPTLVSAAPKQEDPQRQCN